MTLYKRSLVYCAGNLGHLHQYVELFLAQPATYTSNRRFILNVTMCVTSATAIAALCVLSGCARVETVNTTEDLMESKTTMEYMFSHPMLEAMYRLGVEADRRFGLQLECKSQYHLKPFSASVVQPIEFHEGKQHPTKGVWRSRYQLERCGDSKVYNALFIADSNGEIPTPRAYHPGSTNAGPQLVQDAMMGAVARAEARSGLKDCKTFYVFDMRVTEPAHNVVEKETTFRGVWNELWTFSICGKMVDVPMTFIPDARGGGTTYIAGQ